MPVADGPLCWNSKKDCPRGQICDFETHRCRARKERTYRTDDELRNICKERNIPTTYEYPYYRMFETHNQKNRHALQHCMRQRVRSKEDLDRKEHLLLKHKNKKYRFARVITKPAPPKSVPESASGNKDGIKDAVSRKASFKRRQETVSPSSVATKSYSSKRQETVSLPSPPSKTSSKENQQDSDKTGQKSGQEQVVLPSEEEIQRRLQVFKQMLNDKGPLQKSSSESKMASKLTRSSEVRRVNEAPEAEQYSNEKQMEMGRAKIETMPPPDPKALDRQIKNGMAPAQAILRANIGRLPEVHVMPPQKSLARAPQKRGAKPRVQRSLSDGIQKPNQTKGKKSKGKKTVAIAQELEDSGLQQDFKTFMDAKIKKGDFIIFDVEGEGAGPTRLMVKQNRNTGYVSAGWITDVHENFFQAQFLESQEKRERNLASKKLHIGKRKIHVDGTQHIDALLHHSHLERTTDIPKTVLEEVYEKYWDIAG